MLCGKVSVVVPAYNESSHIRYSLRAISNAISAFAPDHEIILVDDGSSDDTSRKASQVDGLGAGVVRVLRYEPNRGKGYALACGTRHATGDYVAFIDADLELHPGQLPGFFDRLLSEHADAVIGSKWHPESVVEYPAWRRLLSLSYFGLTRMLFDLPLRDTQTGLKVFRAAPLKMAVECLLAKKFAFDVELLAVMHRFGNRIVEAPVELRYGRKIPRLRLADAARALVDTMAIFYRIHVLHYYDRERTAVLGNASDVTEFTIEPLDLPLTAGAAVEP